MHEKPALGSPPVYITQEVNTPSSPATSKFNVFRQALLQNQKGLPLYRSTFLTACLNYADSLRVRERPNTESPGKKIIEDFVKLKMVRNHIVDWVLLEGTASPTGEFTNALIDFLEKLRELKTRPPEINSWSDFWFEAHALFVYETFLYIVAALLKADAFNTLHEVFTSHYISPAAERRGDSQFDRFDCFLAFSQTLQSELAPAGRKLHCPSAELIKQQADRQDLPFTNIIEADLLILLMAFLIPDVNWYPQTLHYSAFNGSFPFFTKAAQHKHFVRLTTITGINDPNKLRELVKNGQIRLRTDRWHDLLFNNNFWASMNIDKLDSIKYQ